MMRKLMVAVLGATLSFGVVAPLSAATASKDQQEQQLLLKKKKQAAKLAAEKKKVAEAKAKQDALKKQQAQKLAVMKKKQQLASAGSAKKCKFLECLFGKREPRVTRNGSFFQTASFSASKSVAADRVTRQTVSWSEGKYAPGSIIVRTPERALYLVLDNGKALRYSVGVGREGFQWSGSSTIGSKQEWPGWTPPKVMIEREAAKGHILPAYMPGGPENPLGARALYISGTMFRVHGTNNAASIGGAVSSGCIRMMNTDVIDLYDRVKLGSRIYVYQ